MRRATKVKALATRMPLRKAAGAVAARRDFPAWIVADESGATFTAKAAMPRVRDALVLRIVGKKKSANPKRSSHGPGAR